MVIVNINHRTYPISLKNKSDDSLHYIMKDAYEAMKANPEGTKAGYYADEVNYCGMELAIRSKAA